MTADVTTRRRYFLRTSSVTLVVWLRLPEVPVITGVQVPHVPCDVLMVTEPGDWGLPATIVNVAPAGSPLTLKFTLLVKPLTGLTVTV
jgi:hypothetical protein